MPGDELYCYPGGDVLKNKLNITDAELLEYAERRLTAIRLDELLRRRVRGDFDFAHLKAIHFFVFQDLYTWAGQQRKINILECKFKCSGSPFTSPFMVKHIRQNFACSWDLQDLYSSYGWINSYYAY